MEPTLKVGYVVKRFPHLSQTFILNEILGLERQGVPIEIFALREPVEEVRHEALTRLRAKVTYLPLDPSLDDWPIPGTLQGPTLPESPDLPSKAAALATLARARGVKHLHAHFGTSATTVAMVAGESSGIPYSFTAHARDIYHETVNRRALAQKIGKAAFVITVSDFNRNHLEALVRAERGSGRIIRLYNGIDLDRFRPDPGGEQPDLIVGVGRLVAKKGFDYLIQACRILKTQGKTFRCLIVGDGEERMALGQQVVLSGLQQEVSMVGARSQSEVMHIIRGAAMLVLPCVVAQDGDRDGLPTVLLESMALGTPVISTRICGIPEIIRPGHTGLLVEERDPQALARAMQCVLDSEDLRDSLSASALIKVREDFNLASNVKRLRGYFLSSQRHPGRAGSDDRPLESGVAHSMN